MPTDAFLALPNPDLLRQVGQGLKRVAGANEQPDTRGFRTVWHHGPMKTDLFTHLSPDGDMVRQELVFLGQVVAWDHRGGLSTGLGGETGSAATPAAQTLNIDDQSPADRRILAHASLLLREVPDADVYVLHLRKIINETLTWMGDPHSLIRDIEPDLRAELQRLYEAALPDAAVARAMTGPPAETTRKSRTALLFLIGLGVGVGLVVLWALLS